MSTITKNQLDLWLKKWVKILGLQNYLIIVLYEDCDDKYSYMEITRSRNEYQRAKLVVPKWLIGESKVPDDLLITPNMVDKYFWEESLVHELLHVCVNPMTLVVRNDLDGYLHHDVFNQVEKAFIRAEEKVVDNLAVALCKAYRDK